MHGIWGGPTEKERNQQAPARKADAANASWVIRDAGESCPARTAAAPAGIGWGAGPLRVRSG